MHVIKQLWMPRVGIMLLGGTLLGALIGCGHDPNHDINMEQARAAASRVHSAPKLSPSDRKKVMQDHGG
jgi:hypothetical protein